MGQETCRRCGAAPRYCECPQGFQTGRSRNRNQRQSYDGGYGTIGNQSAYYDTNPDGSTNIFPGGMPAGKSSDSPHEKLIISKSGGVVYWREKDGNIINDHRDYHG